MRSCFRDNANNNYAGMMEVRAGTLALSGPGKVSDKLALYNGTTFNTGGVTVNNLSRLDIHGTATWTGDLDMAAGDAMNFYIPVDVLTRGSPFPDRYDQV